MKNKSFLVAPSLLSADFSRLGEEILAVEKAGADWIHIDVMDGNFVPDLSFGPPVVQKLRSVTKLPFDVHLMVSRPENFIEPFALAGADFLTFHIEAASRPLSVIRQIKKFKMKAGISLRPETSVETLRPFLDEADLILIMTVQPGKGGQAFLRDQAEKISRLDAEVKGRPRRPLISVDGGVTAESKKQIGKADALVSGSYIFQSRDYSRAVAALKAPSGS